MRRLAHHRHAQRRTEQQREQRDDEPRETHQPRPLQDKAAAADGEDEADRPPHAHAAVAPSVERTGVVAADEVRQRRLVDRDHACGAEEERDGDSDDPRPRRRTEIAMRASGR